MAKRKDHPAAGLFPMFNEERLAALAESIRTNGQRHPIVMLKGRILDGRNRWEACRIAKVKPRIVQWDDDGSPFQFVWDINAQRRDLSPGQRAAIFLTLAEADDDWHESQAQREAKANKARGKAAKARREAKGHLTSPVSPDTGLEQERTRERLAAASGTSSATIGRVTALRKRSPKLFSQVAEGRVTLADANRELKRKKKAKITNKIKREPQPPPQGPFRVIALDPPWRYEQNVDKSTSKVRGLVDYADMSVEEICALPVLDLAHDDCILWLWTTNAFMREAYACIEAWGFEPKTILTWEKQHIGVGHWLRNVTEHCILAVRGKPTVTLSNQSTFISEIRREHSRKPEAFYGLVESLCPGSKLEMFAREERSGWTAWGAESTAFSRAAE